MVCRDDFGIHYDRAGEYKASQMAFNLEGSYLRGMGSGCTIIHVPAGVVFNAPNCHIEGVTLIGHENQGIGLTVLNGFKFTCNDVRIIGYNTGIVTDIDISKAPKEGYVLNWMHDFSNVQVFEAQGGGRSKHSKTATGIKLLYSDNNPPKKPGGGWPNKRAFTNTHRLNNVHVNTTGCPLLIDGVSGTKISTSYFECRADNPIEFTDRSPNIDMYGCDTEVHKGDAHIKLGDPKYNRFAWYGHHSGLLYGKGRIVNGKGEFIKDTGEDKYVHIYPEGYY